MVNVNSIDTTTRERSSEDNWLSPTSDSLKMLQNLNHDYIVSDVSFANYTLNSTVTVLQGDDDGIGVVFDYINANNYKYIMYQGGGLSGSWGGDFGKDINGRTNALALFEVVDGEHSRIQQSEAAPYWSIDSTFKIKLENLFDDVFFYINDIELLRYKKNSSVSGKVGFVTFSQIANFNEITLNQARANRAKAKYVLYAMEESDINAAITISVGRNNEIETAITPRAYSESDIDTEIFAKYRGNSDVWVEIQPIGYNDIDIEIEVPPHNRMWALYEVQQPPIVTTIVNPFQDSFTRERIEYQTINYGASASMVVGRDDLDIWRSFVQFDLSFVNPSYILTESHLRLYYKGMIPDHVKLEVLNADTSWEEYNITHANRPIPIKLIVDEFTVNQDGGYIEFDVLNIIEKWIALTEENNGFIIRASNESDSGQTIFYTRETMLPPELIVKHYDSRIFSAARSQVNTEIFVWKASNSDKNTEIEITSTFDHSIVLTEIYCHQRDVPLDSDISTEITASMDKNEAIIIAAIRKNSEVLAEIGSRLPLEDNILSQISVTRSVTESEIYIKHTNNIETEIYSRGLGENHTLSQISVSRETIPVVIECARNETLTALVEIFANVPHVYAEIYVKHRNDKNVEINIITDNKFSKIPTEISISKENISTEITSRVATDSEVYTKISATKDSVHSQLEVKYRSDVWVEIEPNIKSDILTEIISSTPSVHAEIAVILDEKSDKNTEIFIPYSIVIETEIDIKLISQIDVEINVKSVSQININVATSKPYILTSVTIPTWADFDMLTAIEPRIFMVNNIYTVIQVGAAVGAYAFII